MPEANFFILGAVQLPFLLIYRWVGKAYIFQSRENHPAIFWNPVFAKILCAVPIAGLVGTVLAAFLFLSSPWWFAAASVVSFIIFSSGLKTPPASVDETHQWLTEHNINTDGVRYYIYADLARTPGATVIVGMGTTDQDEKIGFAVEILPGRGVVTGETIEPYGIVTHHKAAARAAKQHGTCLIDALLFLAKQHKIRHQDTMS